MQSIKLYQVDAFTGKPFHGNPAAVCPLDEWLPDATMQAIAQETNLSETAFLVADGEDYVIRWFAPGGEVELCGHATLSAAQVVFQFLNKNRKKVRFRSPQHELVVKKAAAGIEMDFPAFSFVERAPAVCPHPLKSRGLQGVYEGNGTLVLRLDDEDEVRRYKPDLAFLERENIFLTVTGEAEDADFASRFFAPSVGIDEDPVTGSVHCLLAPIWSQILQKSELKAHQVSSRGGELKLTVTDSGRVIVTGQAVCVLQGDFYLEGC
jgi:predicted PhzF superfamily epimerase YddE/YHI9